MPKGQVFGKVSKNNHTKNVLGSFFIKNDLNT